MTRGSGGGQEETRESGEGRRESGGGRRESGEGDNSDGKLTGRMDQGRTVVVASQADEEASNASEKSGNEKLADLNGTRQKRGIVEVATLAGEQQQDGEVGKAGDDEIFGEPSHRSRADDTLRKFENGKDICLNDFSDQELVEKALEEEFDLKKIGI